MPLENKTGCFTDKQLRLLNDRLPEFPFELGTVLDCIFQKIIDGGAGTQTVTSLTFNPSTFELCYEDELLNVNKIPLNVLNDDTNLPRIVSMNINPLDSILTLTRDDSSTITEDLSYLLDDRPRIEMITLGGPESDMLTFTRDDSSTMQVDFSPLVTKIKEDLMQPKCGWACDANNTTVWFVKTDTGISYYTDPTETVAINPLLPLGPPASDGARFDVEHSDGWVVDSQGDCFYYVYERISDLKAGTVSENTIFYTGTDRGTVGTPVLPVKDKGAPVSDMLVSSTTLVVGDTTVEDLLPIPPGATGAVIQVESTGCLRFFADGTTPSSTTGFSLANGGTFNLGCLASDDEGAGDIQELTLFKAISEIGASSTLTITYYKKV